MGSAEPRHAGESEELPSLADTAFDELLREVLGRVNEVLEERERWQLLLDAVVSMAAGLSLDELLRRIIEVAADLAGARYVALGVLGFGKERRLDRFITHGLNPAQIKAIGDLPSGHGILGLIIDHPEPIRLHDISAHPASYGFPPDHPPMRSFLGVPVRLHERVFGNLYLTEKAGGGDFTDHDESIVVALAAAAGVAIENARLHAEAARREQWLAATAEVTRLLMIEPDGETRLQTLVEHAMTVADADIAGIMAFDADGAVAVRALAGVDVPAVALPPAAAADSPSARVMRSGEPTVVEDLSASPWPQAQAPELGFTDLGPGLVVPMRAAAGVEGAMSLGWRKDRRDVFDALDLALPIAFAEQAALALEVARAREDQQRLVLFEDRDRIGRDLHDLIIQRLFAVGLGLQSAGRLTDDPDLAGRLDSAVDDLDATIRDIRRTIFALGSMDQGEDIQAEITRIVDRAAGTLKFRPSLTFDGPVRTLVDDTAAPDVLAVLGEALSNAARHAEATSVWVALSAGEAVTLTVRDNGRGLPQDAIESGLANMRRRAERLGGHCAVVSAPGEGTTVEWSVPASTSAR
jgi:two-component system, NarL family, sensor histidine kinase DevS